MTNFSNQNGTGIVVADGFATPAGPLSVSAIKDIASTVDTYTAVNSDILFIAQRTDTLDIYLPKITASSLIQLILPVEPGGLNSIILHANGSDLFNNSGSPVSTFDISSFANQASIVNIFAGLIMGNPEWRLSYFAAANVN